MDKKELLREKAITVFAEEGYHSSTVKMIAQEAEVAVGTVYNYFTNKQEILNYTFAVEFNKKINLLNQIKAKDIPLKEKLTIFLDAHFNDLKYNPNLAVVLVQESRRPKKHSLQAVEKFVEQLPKIFSELLEQAQENKEIRMVDSDLIANAIFRTIRGVATNVVENEDYSFAEAQRELINFFCLGLGIE